MKKIIITLLLLIGCMTYSSYATPPKSTPEERAKVKDLITRVKAAQENRNTRENLGMETAGGHSKAASKTVSNHRNTNDPKDNTLEVGSDLARSAFEGKDPSNLSKLQKADDKDYKYAAIGFENAGKDPFEYNENTRKDIQTANKKIATRNKLEYYNKAYQNAQNEVKKSEYKKHIATTLEIDVSKLSDKQINEQVTSSNNKLTDDVKKLYKKFEKDCKSGSCLAGPKK